MRLRPLRPGDVEAVQTIDRDGHGQCWSRAAFLAQIRHRDVDHLVADDDGIVLGHAGLWRDGSVARITNVSVAASAGGRGVATALLCALLVDVDVGIEEVRLEVRPVNRRAQRLYGRFGFAQIGVERGFYDRSDASGSRDALVMTIADPHDGRLRNRIEVLSCQESPV